MISISFSVSTLGFINFLRAFGHEMPKCSTIVSAVASPEAKVGEAVIDGIVAGAALIPGLLCVDELGTLRERHVHVNEAKRDVEGALINGRGYVPVVDHLEACVPNTTVGADIGAVRRSAHIRDATGGRAALQSVQAIVALGQTVGRVGVFAYAGELLVVLHLFHGTHEVTVVRTAAGEQGRRMDVRVTVYHHGVLFGRNRIVVAFADVEMRGRFDMVYVPPQLKSALKYDMVWVG